MTVVLDGDKIRLATDSDNKDNIIGVVSVNPVVLVILHHWDGMVDIKKMYLVLQLEKHMNF